MDMNYKNRTNDESVFIEFTLIEQRFNHPSSIGRIKLY